MERFIENTIKRAVAAEVEMMILAEYGKQETPSRNKVVSMLSFEGSDIYWDDWFIIDFNDKETDSLAFFRTNVLRAFDKIRKAESLSKVIARHS